IVRQAKPEVVKEVAATIAEAVSTEAAPSTKAPVKVSRFGSMLAQHTSMHRWLTLAPLHNH
ncbi:hypothetical protein, partial [Shewanella sp. SG44-2]|uniref:hypothetical protein n=1 Tax=Shewanella sp. SG44-2 TaxID=2760962 RepID=UPI0028734CE7